jgi:hypothetical protein
MATRTARSLRHEYELHVQQEIENYKESIPRSAILAIGDEAAARLAAQPQFTLSELLLCEEVDRIIFRRIRLPTYNTWKRKRLKLQDELRRPEHWGFSKDDALVRTIGAAERMSSIGRILVAGEGDTTERSALFLAANGCNVTAIDEEAAIERVMTAALQAGLAERIHTVATDLTHWTPDAPLRAVVCSHAALNRLAAADRARVIRVLQGATSDGGVHLVETLASGAAAIEELTQRYAGWAVSVEAATNAGQVFCARKAHGSAVSH